MELLMPEKALFNALLFSLGIIVLVIVSLIKLARRPIHPTDKLLLCLGILLVPLIGALVFLLSKKQTWRAVR